MELEKQLVKKFQAVGTEVDGLIEEGKLVEALEKAVEELTFENKIDKVNTSVCQTICRVLLETKGDTKIIDDISEDSLKNFIVFGRFMLRKPDEYDEGSINKLVLQQNEIQKYLDKSEERQSNYESEIFKTMKKEAREFLNKKNYSSSIQKLFEYAPLKTKNNLTKKNYGLICGEIISAIPTSAIKTTVTKLSEDENDLLMKIVYLCLSKEKGSNKIFFSWHKAIVNKNGVSAIVKVLTDKSNVV